MPLTIKELLSDIQADPIEAINKYGQLFDQQDRISFKAEVAIAENYFKANNKRTVRKALFDKMDSEKVLNLAFELGINIAEIIERDFRFAIDKEIEISEADHDS